MCVGEELDLLLQVLKGRLEVCHLLLMMVLSGPDSGDEALGHCSEDTCIKIWVPSKDVSSVEFGESGGCGGGASLGSGVEGGDAGEVVEGSMEASDIVMVG